jgi:hypothetical protein
VLPEFMKKPTIENGAQILSKKGINVGFVQNMFQRYGKFGSKLGINNDTISSAVNAITGAMGKSKGTDNKGNGSNQSIASKYPSLK